MLGVLQQVVIILYGLMRFLCMPHQQRSVLSVFLINAAYEMESNDVDHIHLQDQASNFSRENHVDIIAINRNKIKPR